MYRCMPKKKVYSIVISNSIESRCIYIYYRPIHIYKIARTEAIYMLIWWCFLFCVFIYDRSPVLFSSRRLLLISLFILLHLSAVGIFLLLLLLGFIWNQTDKPDPLTNCSVSHQSSESLQIACSEGFSGGLPQNFLLEIFAIDAGAASPETAATTRPTSPELKTNQTSMKPVFIVRGLDADTAYVAHVTAVNAKGRSEPLVVRVVTLRPPETQKNIGPGKSEGIIILN